MGHATKLNFGFICLEHQPLSLAGVVTESSCLGHAVALRPFFDVLRVCQDQASQGATPCQPVAGPHLAFGVSHRGQLQINAIHSGWSCSHMFSPIQSKKVSRDQHVYTCITHLALRVCCGRWMSLRSLLTAADLMKQTSDLTEMQTKAWKMQSMPTTPSTFSKPLSPCKWASVQDLKEEAKWMDKSNDVKCLCYLCLPIIWISIILHPSSLPAKAWEDICLVVLPGSQGADRIAGIAGSWRWWRVENSSSDNSADSAKHYLLKI